MSIREEYKIQKHHFNKETIEQLCSYSFAQDYWPVVYLLKARQKNAANLYVGETIDIVTRLSHHIDHPDKSKLDECYLVHGNKFNKSATLDIEANLIRYLAGDGYHKLLNANLGLADHNYYQREVLYQQIFKSIWEELRHLGIAVQPLEEIDNSDLFKYSPYKSLSAEQTKSLILLLEAIADDKFSSFVLQGGAGSGKTVLAVFLFKLLNTPDEDFNFGTFGPDDQCIMELVSRIKKKYPNPEMALVIPMDSFRSTVQSIFKHVKGLRAEMVVAPAELGRKRYNIVLVDEAHRLRRRKNLGTYFGVFDKVCAKLELDKSTADELDWVTLRSDKRILFYDEFQSVKPSDVPAAKFDLLKDNGNTNTQYLNSQFRVRGGLKYVKFIDRLLRGQVRSAEEKFTSKKYEFVLFDDLAQMIERIKQKDAAEHLARVVAGYAWEWPSKKNKAAYDIEIDALRLRWNSIKRNWINSPNAVNEVGCIHTVQGYDLNYAGVIFGNEIGYDNEREEIFIRKENYHDRNGKNGVKNPGQLKEFIINIYKTLMLRGIKGTYVYVCDKALRDYFARCIPVFNVADGGIHNIEDAALQSGKAVRFYDLAVAAGVFSEQQIVEKEEWYPVEDDIRITEDHFACRVVGESMNKLIPSGAVCLFRKYTGGTREGKIVLALHRDKQDAEFGANYTIKEYSSEKQLLADGTWRHKRIVLKPKSTDTSFTEIVLEESELAELKVVGIFERVLSM